MNLAPTRLVGNKEIENRDSKIENPERAWERADHREVDAEQLAAMLQAALPAEDLVSAELIPNGKANANYRIELSTGRRVLLRLYIRDPGALGKEVALAKLVQPTVPVAQPLYSDPEAGFSVWEWKEGRLLEEAMELLPGCAYDLGSVLGSIGEFQFEAAGFLADDLSIGIEFGEACEAYIGRMRECLGMDGVRSRLGQDLARQTEQHISDHEALLDLYRGAHRLVHSDYKVANLLVDGSKVSAVLDWEFAHSGSPLLDVSILFRHSHDWAPEIAEQFEQGFRDQGGFLAPGWREAARYLDLVSLLDFLSRPGLGDRATADVVRLVRDRICP